MNVRAIQNKLAILKRQREGLDIAIRGLECQLRNAVKSCQHQFGAASYYPHPFRPNEPPGASRPARWKRTCAKCGKVEYITTANMKLRSGDSHAATSEGQDRDMAKTVNSIPEVSITGYIIRIDLEKFPEHTDEDEFYNEFYNFAHGYNTDEITIQEAIDHIKALQVNLSVDSGVGPEKARQHVETILKDFFQNI